MFNFNRTIKSFWKKQRSPEEEREALARRAHWEHFAHLPHHEWIVQDKALTRSFEMLFAQLELSHLDFFRTNKVYFLTSTAEYSCSLGLEEKCRVVLVFPELVRMLKTFVPHQGLAIVAHELGHIFHNHYQRQISSLKAQIEADAFAVDAGFGHHLQDILLQYPDSEECRVRINYLTTRLAKSSS